jgi:hypothetical protein
MHQQKITPGEMRASGVCGLLVFCADYRCSHLRRLASADVNRWSGDVRLSDLEPRFICTACGKRGGDVRPDFNWNKKVVAAMGYR